MNFAMAQYEVKYHGSKEWEEISEVEVLMNLQNVFVWVTPSIQDMLQGKAVVTAEAIYRLKGIEREIRLESTEEAD